MSSEQPVTEKINTLSVNIDVASPQDMVKILQKCDEEIFSGWENYPGMSDNGIHQKIATITNIAQDILRLGTKAAIVLSGCGTSGRLGFITARTFNLKLEAAGREPCFHYIMAGGDKALFTSQEAIEDDPVRGMQLLNQLCKDKSRVLYFGITCGLSAPFVAGQLQLCMDQPQKYTPVLVGFNPACLARNLPIEKWDKTFFQVVEQLEKTPSGYILNPIVGPDPIAGSSRMKSGSATKILLELVLMPAYLKLCINLDASAADLLKCYKMVCDSVYTHTTDIGVVIELAGSSLNAGGHIYYLSEDSLGIMGMIDASECPPTYGATLDDVRGFVASGFDYLRNNEGDISQLGRHFCISLKDFQKNVAPTVSSSDLVIVLTQDATGIPPVADLHCKKVCVIVSQGDTPMTPNTLNQFDAVVQVPLPSTDLTMVLGEAVRAQCWQVFREIATKWILNAITTGAHILKGKVYQNIMVDLHVSNNKLFYRSVGIIQHFSKLNKTESIDYLLKSIYNTDTITKDIENTSVTDHIKKATLQHRVVPTALLVALSKCSIAEAKANLDAQPIIRTAIFTTLEKADSL